MDVKGFCKNWGKWMLSWIKMTWWLNWLMKMPKSICWPTTNRCNMVKCVPQEKKTPLTSQMCSINCQDKATETDKRSAQQFRWNHWQKRVTWKTFIPTQNQQWWTCLKVHISEPLLRINHQRSLSCPRSNRESTQWPTTKVEWPLFRTVRANVSLRIYHWEVRNLRNRK